jgi:hypothetical protein
MPAQKKPAARSARPVKTAPAKARRAAPAKPVAAPLRETVAAAPAVTPVVASTPSKPAKPPKLHRKPVRDSFTMPEADFALIATLKARALAGHREAKKSELLRAGLHALAALDTASLVQALGQLEPVQVGRPKKAR